MDYQTASTMFDQNTQNQTKPNQKFDSIKHSDFLQTFCHRNIETKCLMKCLIGLRWPLTLSSILERLVNFSTVDNQTKENQQPQTICKV